jgi:AcrR family transcriptional regulator
MPTPPPIVMDEAVAAGRREERKAQNRAKLLAGARRVFADKGLGAASARDIVRETDLATGTFYNYFDDKEQVFRALFEEVADRARAAVREQRQTPGLSLDERLEAAYLVYFELAIEERELFAVLRRNAELVLATPEEDWFEVGIAELLEDLREWAADGELPDVDLDYLATAMVGVGFQVATHLVERPSPDPAAAARFCTRLVLDGVRGLELT